VMLQRHQLVNNILQHELQHGVHALSIVVSLFFYVFILLCVSQAVVVVVVVVISHHSKSSPHPLSFLVYLPYVFFYVCTNVNLLWSSDFLKCVHNN